MAKLSRSALYYRKNRAAAAKKKKYDAELNKRPNQVQKRVEANRARRRAKAAGKDVRGLDFDHSQKKFVKSSVNRGRTGEGNRIKRRK